MIGMPSDISSCLVRHHRSKSVLLCVLRYNNKMWIKIEYTTPVIQWNPGDLSATITRIRAGVAGQNTHFSMHQKRHFFRLFLPIWIAVISHMLYDERCCRYSYFYISCDWSVRIDCLINLSRGLRKPTFDLVSCLIMKNGIVP